MQLFRRAPWHIFGVLPGLSTLWIPVLQAMNTARTRNGGSLVLFRPLWKSCVDARDVE